MFDPGSNGRAAKRNWERGKAIVEVLVSERLSPTDVVHTLISGITYAGFRMNAKPGFCKMVATLFLDMARTAEENIDESKRNSKKR